MTFSKRTSPAIRLLSITVVISLYGCERESTTLRTLDRLEANLDHGTRVDHSFAELIELTRHRNPRVRTQSLIISANYAGSHPALSETIAPVLGAGLSDPDPKVRREAVIGLKSQGARAATQAPQLAKALLDHPDTDVAELAAAALSSMPEQAVIAIPAMTSYLQRGGASPAAIYNSRPVAEALSDLLGSLDEVPEHAEIIHALSWLRDHGDRENAALAKALLDRRP